jgi:hypothetical protein
MTTFSNPVGNTDEFGFGYVNEDDDAAGPSPE